MDMVLNRQRHIPVSDAMTFLRKTDVGSKLSFLCPHGNKIEQLTFNSCAVSRPMQSTQSGPIYKVWKATLSIHANAVFKCEKLEPAMI